MSIGHTVAPRVSWLAMPRVLVPIAGAAAVVVLLFAAALWAEASTEQALAGAQADLAATRGVISSHAATMRAHGQRLLEVTQASTSLHRAHWVGDAQQMLADAARLDDTARLIGSQAALLGQHPGQTVRSDLSFVHSTGVGLVAEGDQLVMHGQAMREHALAMEELGRVSETDIATADADLLRDGADRLVDAGERTRAVGALLRSIGEQFMRSLGR